MSRRGPDDADAPLAGPRRRNMVVFARLLTLYLAKDEDSRIRLAAMASVVGDPGLSAAKTDGVLVEIEGELLGEGEPT